MTRACPYCEASGLAAADDAQPGVRHTGWVAERTPEVKRYAPVGLLLGTRNYECSVPYFEVGGRFRTVCQEQVRDSLGMGSFACRIEAEDSVIAEASLAVFETPDDSDE